VSTKPFSRREARHWALSSAPDEPHVDVLIPTKDRPNALAVTLAGLAAQNDPPFRVIISDQSDEPVQEDAVISALLRILTVQGRRVDVLRHVPARGMAEQRAFLLGASASRHILFLDDDVWLEPDMLERLDSALDQLGCGLVGAAVQGLSHIDDRRPHELARFQPWRGGVKPEHVRPGSAEFDRFKLHNAANLTHIAAELDLEPDTWLPYKIAWVGACVMFRRQALVDVGGFEFWRELPSSHVGEDVVAQWRVIERYGGAGIVPSGAVHLEANTTLPDRRVEASDVIPV
jgi:GT2 family glycosyltransferase